MANLSKRTRNPTSVTIANGGTTSGEIDLTDIQDGGFIIPAAFTGTTLSFLVSNESGGTFSEVKTNANAAIAPTVNVSRAYPFRPEVLAFNFAKIVSNGAEAAERTILISIKKHNQRL